MTFKSVAVVIGSFVVMMSVAGYLFAQSSGEGTMKEMKGNDKMAAATDTVIKNTSPSASSKAVSKKTHGKKLAPQKTCPVMGNPIDKSIYIDYKGKRVFFCCAGCPEAFKKDPEKYLKILAEKGEAVEDAPKK